MARLLSELGVSDDSRFVTFDGAQSRSLLAAHHVEYVPYIAPRALRRMMAALPDAARIIRDLRPEVVFSTGAGIAVPYLTAATLRGIPAVYLESVSRILGPSLTGKLLARNPRVRTFTPHPHLVSKRWRLGPSVLDHFSVSSNPAAVLPDKARVFVTLGTIQPYRFDRLVDRILKIAEPGWQLTWQLGCTTRSDLPGRSYVQMSAAAFDEEIRASDVVISHAGVGSALRIMELGKAAILVPRDPRHHEHVDAHQQQIARFLVDRGLCVSVGPDLLAFEDLGRAYGHRVTTDDSTGEGRVWN